MGMISTGIQLHDSFSPVLYDVCSAVDYATANFNELQDSISDTSFAHTYANVGQQVEQVGNEIDQNTQAQAQFNHTVSSGSNGFDDLITKAARLAATYLTIQAAGKVLDLSDELTQTTSRLNLMNDQLQTTPELFNMIYASARSTHAPLLDTADAIAKMGNNAGAAFNSNAELVAFMEQVNKQFTIGGAAAEDQANALTQLSQAMASGALRGDELNSILESAPEIARAIETNMGWAEGSIRSYAEEGAVTAQVVKESLLNMADETNAKFEQMPLTFSQAMTDIQSDAIMAFQPVLQQLNAIANTQAFTEFTTGAVNALATLASVTLAVMSLMMEGASFIADNWSIIEPIIFGIATAFLLYNGYLLAHNAILAVTNGLAAISAARSAIKAGLTLAEAAATTTATGAQVGLNAALLACPLTWIILLIIALIAIIFAVCSAIAKMTGAAESGFGVMTGAIFVVGATFKNLGLTVANIALGIGNAIAALGSNIMTAFHNAIASVQSWWYDLLSTALTVVEGICEALNKLPFVEFDYSGISSAADDYAAKSAEAAASKESYKSIGDAFNEGMSTFDTFQDGWASTAFDAGASWGDGIADKVSNFSLSDMLGSTDIPNADDYTSGFSDAIANSGMSDNLSNISGDTSAIKDGLDITSENLKYLRDAAEQESINRYTTAEVKVEQTNHNNISSDVDLDGLITGLSDAVDEATEIIVGKGY